MAGTAEEYIDLSQTMLHVLLKIVNPDNTALAEDAPVGPINLLLPSLFSQIDVKLNETLVSQPSNTNAYRAYLDVLTHYGHDSMTSQLTQQLFYKDEAGYFDVVNPLLPQVEANAGLKKRQKFTSQSKTLSLLGPLYGDIFFQERLMLPGVDVKIKLNRNKDGFCLLTSDATSKYKIMIEKATLYVRKVKVNPSVMLSHAKGLENTPAKYPINKVDVKSFTIPAGNMSINKDNLFLGQIPNRIIIGFVDNDSFNGSYRKNPYNFKHYNLNYISITVDGEPLPMRPLRPCFEEGGNQNYIEAYNTLFMGTSRLFSDHGIAINREEYAQGYTLYAFDLTPDLSDGCHLNLVKEGNVRLEAGFDAALPNTVNCIVYSESQGLIQIDRSRNVIYDFKG
ncbi:uncharacterized protein F54H12.2-like [Lytechinus variegatus]|uniref:uncharacterized protein F54H12.2-like n=1 Tax=Lytechinus variegatus TaxID=7654 RepID=UPI001BB17469|nr:uncharacterized protein F54H12.2-like [Lytechinus variegatus]